MIATTLIILVVTWVVFVVVRALVIVPKNLLLPPEVTENEQNVANELIDIVYDNNLTLEGSDAFLEQLRIQEIEELLDEHDWQVVAEAAADGSELQSFAVARSRPETG